MDTGGLLDRTASGDGCMMCGGVGVVLLDADGAPSLLDGPEGVCGVEDAGDPAADSWRADGPGPGAGGNDGVAGPAAALATTDSCSGGLGLRRKRNGFELWRREEERRGAA